MEKKYENEKKIIDMKLCCFVSPVYLFPTFIFPSTTRDALEDMKSSWEKKSFTHSRASSVRQRASEWRRWRKNYWKILSFMSFNSRFFFCSGRELYRAKQLYHSLETTNLQLLFSFYPESIKNILSPTYKVREERENERKNWFGYLFFYWKKNQNSATFDHSALHKISLSLSQNDRECFNVSMLQCFKEWEREKTLDDHHRETE